MATEAQIYAFCLLLFPFSLIPFPFCEAGIFTLVESALQIRPFMQNKPNLRKAKMNIKSFHTVAYENKSNWTLGENKPNTKPIKANLMDAQMNISSLLTKDYENKWQRRVRKNKANTKPIQTQSNPIHPHDSTTIISTVFSKCPSVEAAREGLHSRDVPKAAGKSCQKESLAVREVLIERGRAASTKAMAAISVANLLQQSSDCHDMEE